MRLRGRDPFASVKFHMKLRKRIIRLGKHFLRLASGFQARHSRAEVAPVLDKAAFDFVANLEDRWRDVRYEVDQVLKNPDDIPSFHEISPDQARISKADNWKTFVFYVFGNRIDANCEQCPKTAVLLENIPGLQNACYSILAPGYHIPAHKGPTRAVIRCHLGLIVPEASERCWLRVDDQIHTWREGECLVFDDTYEHEVHNDTPERRVVLFLDFDRPMDRLGALFNWLVIRAIRSSAYVRDPLENLAGWDRTEGDRGAL